MSVSSYIKIELLNNVGNDLFIASKIYNKLFKEKCTEVLFYKTLERMTTNGELIKISKGVYCFPKTSKYGVVPISTEEIVSQFTSNKNGMVIGYSLYNSLNITTQIPKTVKIFSSMISSKKKNIKNVCIERVSLHFSKEIERMIQALEVLENFYNIEDINYTSFVSFIKEIVEEYNDKIFEDVITEIHYKKSTIAFLQEILNYFKKENNLQLYLSTLSDYKHPKMEDIYYEASLETGGI